MASYREVLKKAQVKMEAADRGEQAAFLYLLELTNKEAHNLYIDVYKRQVMSHFISIMPVFRI